MVVVILFALASAAVAVVLVLVGLTYLRAYGRIARTGTTDVSAVDSGMDEVAVSGTARPAGDALPARFEDGDTLLNNWEMTEYSPGGGESGGSWRTQASGMDAEPFLVDDGTGEILVDPEGAEWVLDTDYSLRVDDDGGLPPRPVLDFLDSVDRTPNAERTGRTRDRRYESDRLDPGDDVYVYGPVADGAGENAPAEADGPYIGTEQSAGPGMTTRTTMQLTPGILPFVGDPEATLSLGGADESTLFTVADASAGVSQRRYLKRALIILFISLWFGGFAALVFVM